MIFRKFAATIVFLAVVLPSTGISRVYYGKINPGSFDRQLHIDECEGNTFLAFMIDQIYPAFEEEGEVSGPSRIDGVKAGHGVELRLSDDITTYHVGFRANGRNAERSGRSYSAVGKPNSRGVVPYVADASYAHYLDSFQKIYSNKKNLINFYDAILRVVANCDASGFDKLNTKWKRVAADFVAVYIAEQFRHLISGGGTKLGRRHNWDDALFQTTLLAGFHAGQGENTGMYYEGEFVREVWHQIHTVRKRDVSTREWNKIVDVMSEWESADSGREVEWDRDRWSYCVYKKNYRKTPRGSRSSRARSALHNLMAEYRDETETREMKLRDYWQFNWECKRSGVNITRRDFSAMGKAIAEYMDGDITEDLATVLDRSSRGNMISKISGYFINNSRKDLDDRMSQDEVDELVETIVFYLSTMHDEAPRISDMLAN